MGERSGKWGNVPGELVRGKCERIRGNLELSGKAEATQGGTLGQHGLIYRVPMHFKRNCYEELRTSCATDLRAVIRRFGDEPSRPQSPHSHGTRSLSAIDSLERAPRSVARGTISWHRIKFSDLEKLFADISQEKSLPNNIDQDVPPKSCCRSLQSPSG